ncbi:phosphoribosyl-aminoimidazole-succinocarboxamide synthase [Arthroderma uncinatum]|uniref:phosphoribosyl-aminoimidazole-succinocarboxamide synthase n=1 Tax=Arthroderma uncinatum TaxID=74035 RepID=UPI00144ADBE0|nr:phosphoribosyl-aminoimidazole-succinocarboxamide synthase [Arthroderma uncinatum]KAF3482320.1 phosphoribosyl-aminoimidazole-succinocarboxamide synthase [Arthroderma uncinatum]
MEPVLEVDLKGALPLVSRGKVRDIYQVDERTLLFISTDRVSAYDVLMENGIPNKGEILTSLTVYWLKFLTGALPSLRSHLVTTDLPAGVPVNSRDMARNRSLVVRKLKVFPVEAIVRGYLAGSAWLEYKESGTVHGIPLPAGLMESDKIPDGPLYTPSTKAEQGKHDENIHPDKAADIVGAAYAEDIKEVSIRLYELASFHALQRGIIIADTKFEFGHDEVTNEIVLIDEVLTPDSSRFWSLESYQPGKPQDSFDKQFLRDWLTKQGLKGKEGTVMPEDVVTKSREKYIEAYEKLTGETFRD